jgi:glycosyltransferase involved in cell wall biosynthesis
MQCERAIERTAPAQCTIPATRRVRVLAYVHLRNIYGSTGAGRVARQITEQLAQRSDMEVRILADRSDASRILPLVGKPWTDYPYHLFTADTSKQQARWLALNSPAAERFWPQTDIVYCAGESYVPVMKSRLVVTAHDAAYFEESAHQRNQAYWRQRWKWKILFRKLESRADMIHTVSNFSAERLVHFFPKLANRVRVVPNAVTPRFFAAQSQEGINYLTTINLIGRRYILVPGGLHYRKNADLILQAAPRLLKHDSKVTLVIAGHCHAMYSQKAQQISDRVLLTGFVDDVALHALYGHASVVWYPSRYEGFGLPVLEAMASGAPVVASRASSIPEIAGEAALLAGPDDPMDHVGLLVALLEQPDLRVKFIRSGQARASQFTWAQSAAKLSHYFDEIL